MRSLSPRSGLVAFVLAGAILLSAFLAYQAHTAVSYQRLAVMGVLQDYADFAVDQYRNRSSQRLALPANDLLSAMRESGAADRTRPLRDPSDLRLSEAGQTLLPYIRSVFRLTLDVPQTDHLRTALEPWVSDTVRIHARTIYQPVWYLAGIHHRGAYILYALRRDAEGSPSLAFGVVVDPAFLTEVFRNVEHSDALLPATLTGGERVDSIAAVRVTSADNTVLYATELVGSEYWIESTLGGHAAVADLFGGFRVALSLRPEAASQLVIGGLPRSRLPSVLGTLGLTILLITTAIVQLQRERDLVRRQSDFIASVSHELRTPLAQIRMFAETLRLGRVRTEIEQDRSLAILDSEARRLSHLVDNLLHVARADRGDAATARLRTVELSLGPALREILDGFQPIASSRRVGLRLELDDDLVVRADRSALGQILLNLLDNAVKYGPAGGQVSVQATLASPGRVHLVVEDGGPGVPVGQRDQIWDRFVRLDRDRESAVGGSGIGLAIVRDLAEAQGGRVGIEAASPGPGARFIIDLPGTRTSGSALRVQDQRAG